MSEKMKEYQINSYCKDFSSIDECLQDTGTVINIWGERGIGKTCLLQNYERSPVDCDGDLSSSRKTDQVQIEWLDFSRYTDFSEMTKLDILYSVCHILKDKFRIPDPVRFLMADKVDSERKKRKSYLERSEFSTLNSISEAYDIVSTLVEIPGVGKAIKLMQTGDKLYRKYKPKNKNEKELYNRYKKQANDKDLFDQLPAFLKEDLKHPYKREDSGASSGSTGTVKKILILDNFNPDKPELETWLKSMIDQGQGINWILVSRQKLQLNESRSIEVVPLDRNQTSDLAGFQTIGADQEQIDRFYKLTRGIPLMVALLSDRIRMNSDAGEWSSLEKELQSSDFIARTVLETMDVNRKELLFHLAFIQEFNAESFSHLFPGKFFWLYTDWFNSSLFTRHGNAYSVQQTVRDSLVEYIHRSYSAAVDVINKELFLAERNWLQLNMKNSADSTLKDHISKFCHFGQQLDDGLLFYDGLLQFRDTILKNQGYYYYQVQLNRFLTKLNTSESMNSDYRSSLQISAYEELCNSEIQCGLLESARQHADTALHLLSSAGQKPGILDLYFTGIQLQAEYSSHDPESGKNWNETIKELGRKHSRILQKLDISPFYKFQLGCESELIVIKSLINHSEYEEAEKLLTETKEKFDLLPKAQQPQFYKQMGKVWQLDGERLHGWKERFLSDPLQGYRESEKSLKESRQFYENAEVLGHDWDQELLLESGLTYKRSAENWFKFSEEEDPGHKQAFYYIDRAVDQYCKVIDHIPDVMEACCRTGWAYLAAIHYIWDDVRYFDKSKEYLGKCEKNIGHLMLHLAVDSPEEIQNWKVHNIICDIDRYYIQLYEVDAARENACYSPEERERLISDRLQRSEAHCQTYLKAVQEEHPYALRVYSRHCALRARYGKDDPDLQQQWIERGLAYCDKADEKSSKDLCRKERETLMRLNNVD